MTDREKLVELLDKSFGAQYEMRGLLTAVHTAEYLIANGVTVKQMQKPLTVEEVREKDMVYLEERHGRISCPCLIDQPIPQKDMYFISSMSEIFTHRVKAYNKFWRCWAAKPTDEERQAAPWE